MTEAEIYAAIQAQFPDDVVEVNASTQPDALPLKQGKEVITIERPKPLPYGPSCFGFITVKPEAIHKVVEWLISAPGIELNFPHCVSGVDYKAGEPLCVAY
ncbi:MAG: hypothetical protein KDB07_00560, partial [Planctomycetes bacterium]|nr:hypothetical protein [Planctomycetota bacterium]